MKKLLLSLCLLLTVGLFAHQAQAQTRSGFGIRGGVNFSTLNDVDESPDSRTGIMLGVYANYLIADSPVSIQPEVLYTQKGFEENGEIIEAKVKLDYIEIPVLARFDFITDGNITPNVYFGPYIGFNVNAEEEITADDDPEGEGTFDISDDVKSTDFGVVVGGGLDFGRFDVGVRYGAGLTEVFEDGDGFKNGVFSITVGIGI